MVVTEDVIVDVVESAREQNGHLDRDATWRDVSTSHYGRLRSDFIFLLKQCPLCAQGPLNVLKAQPQNLAYNHWT